MHEVIARLISDGAVVTDGAWGTQMQARGLPSGECPDGWNLSHPDVVEEIPRAYVEAGSRVVLTNTFRGNRVALAAEGLEARVVEVNREGAAISRRAARDCAAVFGSIGPSGKMLCMGEISPEQLRDVFAEQAAALAEGGADAIVIETMGDLAEATLAVEAAKPTGLPIVACMCFDSGADRDRTMMGVTPEQAAEGLSDAGADVIGANCGQGIEGYIAIGRRLVAACDLPVWIKANAGLPKVVDGEIVYDITPARFASQAGELVDAGVCFIGGCCGTSPEFIAALAGVVSMNSRERVLAAINHREPDRVPVDLGGTRQSGIAASTYHQLKSRLGISSPTRVYDVYQMLAEVERPVMERFGADVIGLNRPAVAFGIVNADWKPWQLFDGTPVVVPGGFEPVAEESGDLVLVRDGEVIARMPKDGYYFDRLEVYPGGSHARVEDVNPPVMSDQLCDHYAAAAEALYDNTDFAIIAPLGPPYELFYGLGTGGFETWMMALAAEPDYANSLCEKLVDVWLDNLRRFSQAVGDRVQILQFNDDFGTQDAPFLSTKMFRELIMPHYKRGLDWVHANTEMKVFLHSDGAILPLIPSILEMGVDILNPVQTSARGMDAQTLKGDFGDRLVFWGGSLDCQKTLPFGTPDEVAQEVQEHVGVFAPGGGYVFAPVHNIQANVPPQNVIAMFDAVCS